MRNNEQEDTDNFIHACIIEPVTIEISKKGGELYRKYRSEDITLTSLDCLINATAYIKNHKIATNNTDHYPNKDSLLQF